MRWPAPTPAVHGDYTVSARPTSLHRQPTRHHRKLTRGAASITTPPQQMLQTASAPRGADTTHNTPCRLRALCGGTLVAGIGAPIVRELHLALALRGRHALAGEEPGPVCRAEDRVQLVSGRAGGRVGVVLWMT